MTTVKKIDNFKFYQGYFSNGNSHSVLVGTQIVSSTSENGKIDQGASFWICYSSPLAQGYIHTAEKEKAMYFYLALKKLGF